MREKEAKALVEYIEAKVEKKYEEKKDVLATKQDIADLKADIIKWMFLFWIGQLYWLYCRYFLRRGTPEGIRETVCQIHEYRGNNRE